VDDEVAVRAEFELLCRQTESELAGGVSTLDLFKKPALRKRCIIGFLTTFGAQATGTIVINSMPPSAPRMPQR
jgi:hypothetical protein